MGGDQSAPAPPLVELRDVTRSFPGPPEVQALKSVNLTVHAGDYVSIVGPSGSGKSTMLNILGLVDRPSVGEYRFSGTLTGNLDELSRSALRGSRIGFVFQSFHLMPRRTVLENVMLPMLYCGTPRAERQDRALAALERVGMSHRLGFSPATLSGGESRVEVVEGDPRAGTEATTRLVTVETGLAAEGAVEVRPVPEPGAGTLAEGDLVVVGR